MKQKTQPVPVQVTHKPNLRAYLKASTVNTETFSSGIILSDVDGTLVKGSLILDHAVWLEKSGAVKLGKVTQNWLRDQKNEEHISALALSYRKAIVGMSLKDLGVKFFLENLMGSDNKFYSTLDRLKVAKSLGEEVLLISGSPQYLLGPFGKQFGFTAIGSTYHRDNKRRFTGETTGMFGAKAKRQVVEKLKVENYKKIIAYGDTASDIPLLEVAHHSVLVDPSKETLLSYPNVHEIVIH